RHREAACEGRRPWIYFVPAKRSRSATVVDFRLMRTIILFVSAALISSAAFAQKAVDATACDRVAATLKIANASIDKTTVVPAGSCPPPAEGNARPRPIDGLPSFCRVQLTLTPSSDSNIKTEVWMPLSGWNGKFQQVGNGAFAGSIQYGALGEALKRGYAA